MFSSRKKWENGSASMEKEAKAVGNGEIEIFFGFFFYEILVYNGTFH